MNIRKLRRKGSFLTPHGEQEDFEFGLPSVRGALPPPPPTNIGGTGYRVEWRPLLFNLGHTLLATPTMIDCLKTGDLTMVIINLSHAVNHKGKRSEDPAPSRHSFLAILLALSQQ